MKNRKIIGVVRAALCCGIVALMASCAADDFTRTAGSIPGKDDLATVGGVLRRSSTPEQISMIKIDVDRPAVDAIIYQLTQPATADVSVTVNSDGSLLDEYNKGQAVKLKLFPLDKVSFAGGNTFSIAKGQQLSSKLNVTLSRDGVEVGAYLLPLRATVSAGNVQSSHKDQIIYYRVIIGKPIPATDLDTFPFKVVGYLNTEEMNPLLGNLYTVSTLDADWNEVFLTWFDIVVLRKAAIKYNRTSGRPMLELGADLQYVLSNRDKYIIPLQKAGRKIQICITGGSTGLGFCNMSDAQITDFVYQLKYVVDTYELDGVNFFDIDATYGKDGMPAIIPESYPKLLKATREALGDKLITVACDTESTELLAVAQKGIEAGQYIDYAWAGVFDEIVDAYAEGSKLKPIAGLDQSKYGGTLLKTNDKGTAERLKPILIPAIKSLYRETQSFNVFAFWDMPATSADRELGVVDTYTIVLDAISDFDWEYDGVFYLSALPSELYGDYGKYRKDW